MKVCESAVPGFSAGTKKPGCHPASSKTQQSGKIMTQELQLFNFEKAEVRVVTIDGEPWFVAKDVAEVLGYAKPRNAIASHCKGALIQGVLTAGGMQDMTLIPE
ncbi:hypothetical protein GCM10027398_08410 [Azotobacter salinestris]